MRSEEVTEGRDAWLIYRGADQRTSPEDRARWLDRPPPWRLRRPLRNVTRASPPLSEASERRGRSYMPSGPEEIRRVNIAILLRRPLIVTGPPGVGKSSLAYHVSWCLGLGEPLRWEINSHTTLQDGLYAYDAVDHLRATQAGRDTPLGAFVTLGPLGTALLPVEIPRVLLIDELDKASFDLPNDLLHVFEEGAFVVPELVRVGGVSEVHPCDGTDLVPVAEGRVATRHHPVVVITNNGERSFPEAFLRRCIPLELRRPSPEQLALIVRRHLAGVDEDLVREALDRYRDQTTDVLLQDLFLRHGFGASGDDLPGALRRD